MSCEFAPQFKVAMILRDSGIMVVKHYSINSNDIGVAVIVSTMQNLPDLFGTS